MKVKKIQNGILMYANNKNNKLVIFLHGLFDNTEAYLIRHYSNFLSENSINVFKYNQYGRDSLDFDNITLQKLVKDLDDKILYFKKRYEVVIVAHSFGCLIALLSHHNDVKKVFLEPTIHPKFYINSVKKINNQYSVLHGSLPVLIKNSLLKDLASVSEFLPLVEKQNNLNFIFAEKGSYHYWQKIIDKSNKKFKIKIIKNTDHWFSDKNIENDIIKFI